MIEVLVVDDSKFMLKALVSVLENLGFKVVGSGSDGNEGLEQFKALRPDVTLLDVTMPNMDGVECLTHIIETDPNAAVVMLSAIQDPETVEQCLSIGAKSFLQKPISRNDPEALKQLSDTLHAAVGGAKIS